MKAPEIKYCILYFKDFLHYAFMLTFFFNRIIQEAN